MVVFKPAGVLSQGDKTRDASIVDLVEQYLREKGEKGPYVGLVHRIDRPVSGLLMIGKSRRATELLSRLLRNDRVRKKYTAIIFGVPKCNKGELKNYILEKEGEPTSVVDTGTPGCKEAILEYEVLGSAKYHDIAEFDGLFSLVAVRLITGRKHQIRTQFAALGNPIVGDSKYFTQSGRLKEKMLKCKFLPRGELALCANYISFPHPLANGKIIEVKISIPKWWPKII